MKTTRTNALSRTTLIAIAAGLAAGQDALAQNRIPTAAPRVIRTDVDANPTIRNREAGEKTLVVMIHGWKDNSTMWAPMKNQMQLPGMVAPGTMFWNFEWKSKAAGTSANPVSNFSEAWENTGFQSSYLLSEIRTKGKIDGAGHWDHVHIISHSLGAIISENITKKLALDRTSTIHQTFLDPAIDALGTMAGTIGSSATLAENYYATGAALAYGTQRTGHKFLSAANVELAATSPYSGVTEPTLHHKWPEEWYKEGIQGSTRTAYSAYGSIGYGLSKERADTETGPPATPWITKPGLVGKARKLNGAGVPVGGDTTLSSLPTQERAPGVAVERVSSGNITHWHNPRGDVTGVNIFSDAIGAEYSVLGVDASSDGPVNTLRFEYRFVDGGMSQRDGDFAVLAGHEVGGEMQWFQAYFDTQLFNVSGDAWQDSGFIALPEVVDVEIAGLAFVYQSYDGLATQVEVRSISMFETFAVVPTPGAAALMGMGCLVASQRRRV